MPSVLSTHTIQYGVWGYDFTSHEVANRVAKKIGKEYFLLYFSRYNVSEECFVAVPHDSIVKVLSHNDPHSFRLVHHHTIVLEYGCRHSFELPAGSLELVFDGHGESRWEPREGKFSPTMESPIARALIVEAKRL